MATLAAAIARIDELLEPSAGLLVRAFYDREFARRYSERADFVGDLFTCLDPGTPDQVEPADLLAVHMMGIRFGPTSVANLLLAGTPRDRVLELLGRVPDDIDLWDATEDVLDQAAELWLFLRERKELFPGLDWVTAGKLLARKRPRLIPVIDNVIVTLVPEPPEGYWKLFREYLRHPERCRKVEDLRPSGLPPSTPTLRLLDTALWMQGSRGPAQEIRKKLTDQSSEPD